MTDDTPDGIALAQAMQRYHRALVESAARDEIEEETTTTLKMDCDTANADDFFERG